MIQVVKVRDWSKSRAIVIPSGIHQQLGWRVGDVVQLDVQGDTLIVQPIKLPKARALSPVAVPAIPEVDR